MDDRNFDQQTALEWIKTIEDPSASIRNKDIYPLLHTWLSQASVKSVLDIGCGQGVCSTQFGENQIQYVGVEPSPQLLMRARELYSGSSRTFVEGNAYQLPFSDKRFDAAFSIAVWHLLSDIERASKELSRVLIEEGHFLIITADPAQYGAWIDRYQERKVERSKFVGINRNIDGSSSSDTLYLHSLEEILANLKKQNLKNLETKTIRSLVAISGRKG